MAISNVTTAEGGEYRCVVTAGCGSAISDTALLTVRSYPYYTGDFDDDGDVDQDDFGWFQNCLGREAEPACAPANLNGLGAIDWSDFSKFRACMGGSAIYPPSNCVK